MSYIHNSHIAFVFYNCVVIFLLLNTHTERTMYMIFTESVQFEFGVWNFTLTNTCALFRMANVRLVQRHNLFDASKRINYMKLKSLSSHHYCHSSGRSSISLSVRIFGKLAGTKNCRFSGNSTKKIKFELPTQ